MGGVGLKVVLVVEPRRISNWAWAATKKEGKPICKKCSYSFATGLSQKLNVKGLLVKGFQRGKAKNKPPSSS